MYFRLKGRKLKHKTIKKKKTHTKIMKGGKIQQTPRISLSDIE